MSTAMPADATVAGHDFAHDSAVLGRRKLAHVIPPRKALGAIPIVILLHPFAGNRTSWLRHAPDLMTDLARDTLIVLPECGRKWFIDDHAGARYETYVTAELIPAVRAEFGASGPVTIGGFSAGGAAAVFLALRHPELFASALAVAGAFTAGNREGDPYRDVRSDDLMIPTEDEHDRVWGPPGSATRATYQPAALVVALPKAGLRPRVLIEVGTEDFPRMIEASETMAEALDTAGVPFAFSRAPGEHTWAYAARAMGRLVAQWRGDTP
jgi:pimeloyl-ACP methyl ester carboxylesterase